MAKNSDYTEIIVETFQSSARSAGHQGILVRPAPKQKYPQTLMVECSRKLNTDYPVGTQFKLLVKLTDRQGSGPFLYSSYKWPFEVVSSATSG